MRVRENRGELLNDAYTIAERMQPKLTNISEFKSMRLEAKDPPKDVIKDVERDLKSAFFTGKGDQEQVLALLNNFSKIMHDAVGASIVDSAQHLLMVDDSTLMAGSLDVSSMASELAPVIDADGQRSTSKAQGATAASGGSSTLARQNTMVGRALGYTSEPSTKGLLGRGFSRRQVKVAPGDAEAAPSLAAPGDAKVMLSMLPPQAKKNKGRKK